MALSMHGLLGQISEPRGPIETSIDRFGLPLIVVLIGIAVACGVLWLLRKQRTSAEKMPRSERWFLIGLIGVVAGAAIVMLLRAAI